MSSRPSDDSPHMDQALFSQVLRRNAFKSVSRLVNTSSGVLGFSNSSQHETTTANRGLEIGRNVDLRAVNSSI